MKGIEVSNRYFEQFGMPMLEKEFGELLPYLACGIAGGGSECFGFDDGVSLDHEFEAGFCIFLPGEDVVDRRAAFLGKMHNFQPFFCQIFVTFDEQKIRKKT